VPWVLARELARDGGDLGRRRELVSLALALNLAQGVLAALVVVLVAGSFAGAGVLLALGLSCLGFFAASTGVGWAQGLGRFRLLAVLLAGEMVVKVAAGLALVEAGAGATGALGAALAGALAVAALGFWHARADLRPVRAWERMGALARGAAGMMGVQALVTAIAAVDVVLAAVLLAPADAAGYGVMSALGRVPLFLATALAVTSFGLLARRPGDRGVLSGNLAALLCLAGPVLLGALTVPADLVGLLVPDAYADAVGLLGLTAAQGLALGLITLQTGWFRAAGRFRGCLGILAGGALAVALAAGAGAKAAGPEGLAAGTLLATLGVAGALGLLAERTWPGAQRPALRQPALLALLAAPLVLLVHLPAGWVALAAAVAAASALVARARIAPPLERSPA
jgi:O-antigen/teichoic acid export membrane protein